MPRHPVARPKYKIIDLFAGAGGLTRGFVDAGFEPILAIEKESDFALTYEANFGNHVVTTDITRIAKRNRWNVQADVVIGGPPCQGFSNLTGNKSDDPRRALWKYFMDVVEMSDCKMFLVENVPNLLRSGEGGELVKRARRLGFDVWDESAKIMLASEYGVPQNRRRTIIVGSKLGPFILPEPQAGKVTVRQAFKGIRSQSLLDEIPSQPASGRELHIRRNPRPESVRRYKAVPPGGNRFDLQKALPELTPECWKRKISGGTDLFGRIEWDGPARCTIRTEFYKPEKGRYLHPDEHRPITHWEAARLQSFPDDFKWMGSKISIAIQIGNSVPPKLAEAIAKQMLDHLREHRVRPSRRLGPNELQQLRLPLELAV